MNGNSAHIEAFFHSLYQRGYHVERPLGAATAVDGVALLVEIANGKPTGLKTAGKAKRRLTHHGICVSPNTVVSFYQDSKVKSESLEDFGAGKSIRVLSKGRSKRIRELRAQRAEEYLENQFGSYDVLTNNCQHFANACVEG